MPTQEQLNSPTIHFSSSLGVPSGEAKMKSVVHHKGTGSSASSRDGITFGRSCQGHGHATGPRKACTSLRKSKQSARPDPPLERK